jgi:hypothetical protein
MFPDEMLERAKQILIILEMTDFQWTIRDVLAQPDAELQAVFALKGIGQKVRAHDARANDPEVERI